MSEFRWSDAWLLLAAKTAAGKGNSASTEAVISAGDFINRTKLLPEELDHGQEVLSEANLLHRDGDTYHLGDEFESFWKKSGAGQHRSIRKQLEKIADALYAT